MAAIAALGGLLFGYDTGVMSGALLFLSPEFGLTAHQEGQVTAMLLIGAAIGALLSGRVAHRFGRKPVLIAGGLIFIIGSLWCAAAGSVTSLAAARALLGVAVGGVSIISPMYISELSPAAVRGRMVSLNTLMIVVGQLLAYLVNSALAPSGSWQWMLGLAAVPGAALTVGMFLMPESPVWLWRAGQLDKARAIAARTGAALPTEHSLAAASASDAPGRGHSGEWARLRQHRWLRRTVLLAMLMGLTQQITGVNAIVYFAPTLMHQVGLSATNSVYTSIVIGTVSVLACWVGLQVVDRIGRVRLLLIGLSGNVTSLVILAVVYARAGESTAMAVLSLVFMATFIAFQQAAVSPTTWLLISELVPPAVRGVGMGIAGLSLWLTNWAVAQYFLPVVQWLGGPAAFGIFAVLGLVAIAYTRILVPETMNRSLDEVAQHLQQRFDDSARLDSK